MDKLSVKFSKFVIHIAVWLLLMVISIIDINNFALQFVPSQFNGFIWSSYIVVFYVSYLYLIPKLFYTRKVVLFLLLSATLIVSTFVIIRTKDQLRRAKQYEQYIVTESDVTSEEETLDIIVTPSEKGQDPSFSSRRELYLTMLSARNFSPFILRSIRTFYGLIFMWAAAVLICFFERALREEESRMVLEKERIASELAYLKQQINPHFLFNALNSIYSLTLTSSPESSDAVLRLSAILRYMLYENDRDKVSLSDEVTMIDNYLGLQKLRLTSMTQINYTKTGEFGLFRIEPMVLIPIIENAFKYGIDSSSSSAIDIDISISVDGFLLFKCCNNIVNLNSDEKNSGIGINNIERRLDLLYNDGYELKYYIKEQKYFVELLLQL